MYGLRTLAAAIVFVTTAAAALAGQPEPVRLDPIQHQPAQLTVVDRSGAEHVYTPADLEALGSFRLTTTTPWRDAPAVFEGALLRDLLAAHGLDTVDAIQVRAENDFQTIVERGVWENVDVILATRVDGRAHSRRARGPIQFVVSDSDYMTSGHVQERHLVWMAARIQAAE